MAFVIADTACVDPRATLADGVEIGPFCIVGPDVVLGPGTRLLGHVCIEGRTALGEQNIVHPFCVIGGDPQESQGDSIPAHTIIGARNVIREAVKINRGGGGASAGTRIGSDNQILANAHIAHDACVGCHVSIGNSAVIGPRVLIEDLATLAPAVLVHHDVTVGRLSFIGGQSRIYHDVPPFMLVDGHPARVRCINAVGLRRHRIGQEAIEAIHEAHRLVYRARMQPGPAGQILTSHNHWTPEVQLLLDAIVRQNEGRHGRALETGGQARERTAALN